MSEENHMGWKLVKGVRRDVINLFKLFANTKSVRFEEFSKVWRDIKFSQIFSNKVTIIELLEFTEEIFQITKEYISSVYEFQTRVAALYTLYGMYFKQPIRGTAKIRFTKTEWEDLNSLIENSKSEKHYDVGFIFIKLYLNGAFTFAVTTRPAGLERGYKKYSEKRNTLLLKTCEVELLYRPLISERLVNSFVKLESLYCKKKSELLGKKNLVFIDDNFAQSLKTELEDYASASQGQQTTSKTLFDVEGTSDIANESLSESSNSGVSQFKPKNFKHKSPKSIKSLRQAQNDGNDEVSRKRKKSGKKYLELIAKKKAEYYIKKLQVDSQQDFSKKKLGLMELLEWDDTGSSGNI